MLTPHPSQPAFVNSHVPLTPRTPKSARSPDADADETEMRLLNEHDGHAHFGLDMDTEAVPKVGAKKPFSTKDKQGMALLSVLYLIQGVPIGLALGSIPFILRSHLSYSQIGIFALSGYPYSLKLIWSPIVDSIFFRKIGRRKSWIVPMQLIIGSLMLWIAHHSEELMDSPESHLGRLTVVFTMLVFFAATQDIAVDGWALTLLSPENVSYASTCQTFGLNTGFFASFTVFLALNSEDFAQRWGIPRLTLSAYLTFWAIICYSVTVWLLFFKTEDPPTEEDDEMNLKRVYSMLWSVCKLKHVQSLCLMYFVCKIGFQANEAVTSLKMVEKGLKKEDMALSVLIDFPFQLLGGYLAAKWARGDKPLEPWIWAFWARLGFAVVAMVIVAAFPSPPIPMSFFVLIVVVTITSGFSSTIQFVGVSAFHTRISDPLIGGTYMTLLNTATNLGGTWPKYFVLRGVDMFTVATCSVNDGVGLARECLSESGKKACEKAGGDCVIERDGYYYVSSMCVAIGVVSLVVYIIPTARRLQSLHASKWKVNVSW
ncbi:acetyl-coenzyme A transporter 1-domain-containing protein [Gautieria morchelliformis]|nr:acetyl-coenzyme A transporter 1-domain-containing protein [Gautieria morchelliformis]